MSLQATPENFGIPHGELGFDEQLLLSVSQKLSELNQKVAELRHPEIVLSIFIQEEIFQSRIKTALTFDKDELTKYLNNRIYSIIQCYTLANELNFQEILLTKNHLITFHKIMMNSNINKITSGFRKSDVWLGESKSEAYLIGPDAQQVHALIDNLLNLTNSKNYPPIVLIAIFYAYFLTVHPFLDANGRTGRVITSLLFYNKKLIEIPSFHFSAVLEKHLFEHIKLRDKIITQKEWGNYINFFINLVLQSINDHMVMISELARIESEVVKFTNNGPNILQVSKFFNHLFTYPKTSRSDIRVASGLSVINFQRVIHQGIKANLIDIKDDIVEFIPLSKLTWKQDWVTKINMHEASPIPAGLIPKSYNPLNE